METIDKIKQLNKDIYIQTEIITLSYEIGKYPVFLNPNYKFCNGVIIYESKGTFGIQDRGKWILDEAPSEFYEENSYANFFEKIVPLNTIANGTQKQVYFDKKGNVVATLTVLFILSNQETPNYKKRNIGYSTVNIAPGANTGKLYFNNDFKHVKSYWPAYQTAITSFSLKQSNKYIVENYPFNVFPLTNVKVYERSLPVFHESIDVDYEITYGGGVAVDCMIVYEYEK